MHAQLNMVFQRNGFGGLLEPRLQNRILSHLLLIGLDSDFFRSFILRLRVYLGKDLPDIVADNVNLAFKNIEGLLDSRLFPDQAFSLLVKNVEHLGPQAFDYG